ncbi:FecCD family ABC transporter permease [Roseovarius indicus]|uniref:Iron ABC transporter permease n=1 Tax=Roseovarius indicus TaxID=540747 RepID=A0A0T5P3C5_9RHOB|nr:iron ABC transporter permease [Roseovarius indicus]KRS15698.1 iron ABC transporter permease [Roseovarius indicus]QEW27782.1 putative siderophore transport system permease protein YfhA [Roseovarius indicus]SFE81215.1 iron complex transport system permease protein [Roseovarius indicus]
MNRAALLTMPPLLVVLFLLALAVGDQRLPVGQILGALVGAEGVPAHVETIVTGLRLPRAVMAVLLGTALGVAGAVCQAVMRNPLAEPGLLGINAGAALAAMVVIVQVETVPERLLPVVTFAGAVGMTVAIFLLAWRQGTTSLRLILIGVGLSALAGAGASFISTFGDISLVQRAMVWLSGSLQDSRWIKVQTLFAWAAVPMLVIWLAARELDLLSLGDDVARGRGQRVNLLRGLMMLGCALIAGAAVAAAGPIAFVGLAAPHIARALTGRSHVTLIPASALTGALIVLAADIVARRALAPVQLPVGVVTALLGAPFFGYLLWTKRHE